MMHHKRKFTELVNPPRTSIKPDLNKLWLEFKKRYPAPSPKLAEALSCVETIVLKDVGKDEPLFRIDGDVALAHGYSDIAKDLSTLAEEPLTRPLLREFQQKIACRLIALKTSYAIHPTPNKVKISKLEKDNLESKQKVFLKNPEVKSLVELLWQSEAYTIKIHAYYPPNLRLIDDHDPNDIEGIIGRIFLNSILTYDDKKGTSFSTFFLNPLKSYLRDYIRRAHRHSDRNFAYSLGLLVRPIANEEHGMRPSSGAGEESAAHETLSREETMERVRLAITAIPDKRARDLIRSHLIDGRTLENIGEEHGLTRERVRQIINESVSLLRAILVDDPNNDGRGYSL